MEENQAPQSLFMLIRALCILIVVLMIVAILYAGWISISNYGQIGV